MPRFIRSLGSLQIAAPLLITIAVVLAWGTIYETRYGTGAVQRFIYTSWWFQALLAFLALNLAMAAYERYPWKPRHAPFVLAHIGIILILVGGMIGSRFGIDGQLIIPEGSASRTLQMFTNVLAVKASNPGIEQEIPIRFETQAWVREPKLTIPLRFEQRAIQLTVDRYYPDAVIHEIVTGDGAADNPAVQLQVEHDGQQETSWLFARDPERFGVGWGEAHLLFLEPQTEAQRDQLLGDGDHEALPRGAVSIKAPGMRKAVEVAVPERFDHPVAIEGTGYRLTFKDYFPDFAMSAQGLGSRSDQPNNPAVSFVLEGPEGADPYLLFALHPDFQAMHGFAHRIEAEVAYRHDATGSLPPNTIAIIPLEAGRLAAVLTDAGGRRQRISPLTIDESYTHASLGYAFRVAAYHPNAELTQEVSNRSDTVRAQAVHVTAREGEQAAEAWILLRGEAELPLGAHPLQVAFRPSERELPATVKLLDFRKIDYPGTEMASGFEADVELTDPWRGLMLMRKISMNNPLRYRGYSFFQSSYIPGSPETTVLSVRNDPGTPVVYAGFLIVIAGVVGLFVRPRPARASTAPRGRRTKAKG
ncbi:MAG: cytochrome c biogenesis protein ResB [Candidatus Omnitrophica bacterium]|nr:cytochrome c biogenesis protein ResB [Candidatus Omnitrophota bacterium]